MLSDKFLKDAGTEKHVGMGSRNGKQWRAAQRLSYMERFWSAAGLF
jgi:hypothetical protein